MPDIVKEILKELPEDSISSGGFEGANIVLYTKDKDFFLDNKGLIRTCVQKVKKRIELRCDPEVLEEMESSEKKIRELLPEESTVDNIIFDQQRSVVYIETEKPGVAIGKSGAILKDIRAQTSWVPVIRRTPPMRSQVVDDIRTVLYQNNDERRKFLDSVGHRIYDGWRRGERKQEWVRLSYLGSGRQVGRNCLLLQTQESRVLLDCGIDPTKDDSSAYPYLEAPELNIGELDAVIVTHAHLDHSGFVPFLFKYGYRGPVYCTTPTLDLMVLLMLDMIKIQKSEGSEPIYGTEEIKQMVKSCITVDFEEVTDITPDLRLTFYNSGHILGSAMAHLHVGNGLHNMLYTGDMKYQRTLLLESAHTQFQRMETLLMEATHGNKDGNLPQKNECEALLKQAIVETIKAKGKILIPTSGCGRAQELMVMVEDMVKNKEMKEVPIYLDGMVWDTTAIHTTYPEYLSSYLRKRIFQQDDNPFLHKMFKRVASSKDRKAVVDEKGPSIIIATSGMFNGGPSLHYLRALGDKAKNMLIFTEYQMDGTIGRQILNGDQNISLTKREIMELKMGVLKLEWTSHSDRRELMNFVNRCNPRPKKIVVSHGENSRCLELASSLHKQYRIETVAPRNLETLRLR